MSKKLKLRKAKVVAGDIRIGNFIFHKEEGYVKIADTAGMMSHRISVLIPKGRLLAEAIEQAKSTEGAKKFLESYSVVMFNVLGCVIDNQFLTELNEAAHKAVNRHKDLYGIKDDIDKKEDDIILGEVKKTQEAIKELRGDAKEENADGE